MPRGLTTALTLIRVPRGAARPEDAAIETALEQDRAKLGLAQNGVPRDVLINGPYPIVVDGEEVDEYVVWER